MRWSHDEIRERLRFAARWRLPRWFDEGLAVAVGEAQIRPVDAAAGHEVRAWLRQAGPGGLQVFLARLAAGEDSDAAPAAVHP